MKSDYNMPPGVHTYMIPGNEPEDDYNEDILDIQDEDITLDEFPDVKECRALLKQWKEDNFYPNVYVINDHGNVTLIAVGYNGCREIKSWV